jgi:diacylglycerol kinase (ATP)
VSTPEPTNLAANRARRALILINPKGTRGRDPIEGALRILSHAGIEPHVETPDAPEMIPKMIRANGGAYDLLVLGGGDGTFSLALDAVLESRRPLGILPMGNANDLARTLGIANELDAACRIIANGHRRRIDVGWINGTHFFNVASMGLSVRIARRLTRDRKQRWGILAYLGCAWEALHRQRSFRARIVCDGVATEFRSLQIAVGNGRFYGGGMTIASDATIDDGRLDLYALPRRRGWRLLVLVPVLRWGLHHPIEDILSLHGRTIRIETSRAMPINVDGEERARTPADIRVVSRAIEIFAPAAVKTGASFSIL